MNRKKIGGATIKREDLKSILNDKNQYEGILFKIPTPSNYDGVNLEVYGAKVSSSGIIPGSKFPCDIGSCSIKKTFVNNSTKDFEYEHSAQFSLFNTDEPFFAFFSRSQIEMLLSLGEFEKAFISSFMPVSSNPIAKLDELEPNFSLEIQPLDMPATSMLKQNSNSGSIGLPQTLRAAGCPRTWTQ